MNERRIQRMMMIGLILLATTTTTSAFLPSSSSSSTSFQRMSRTTAASSSWLSATIPNHITPPLERETTKYNNNSKYNNNNLLSLMAAMSIMISTLWSQPLMASAESRVVGEIQGSGLIFKDTLVIESFDDPKVQGITLYISNFQRPLTERLSKDFFSDPSYASVACAKTGPIAMADNMARGKNGEEVFEESRSLLFKTLRVQRIYDADKKTVVYVSFNTRWNKEDDANKSRFKSSICAVSLE